MHQIGGGQTKDVVAPGALRDADVVFGTKPAAGTKEYQADPNLLRAGQLVEVHFYARDARCQVIPGPLLVVSRTQVKGKLRRDDSQIAVLKSSRTAEAGHPGGLILSAAPAHGAAGLKIIDLPDEQRPSLGSLSCPGKHRA